MPAACNSYAAQGKGKTKEEKKWDSNRNQTHKEHPRRVIARMLKQVLACIVHRINNDKSRPKECYTNRHQTSNPSTPFMTEYPAFSEESQANATRDKNND